MANQAGLRFRSSSRRGLRRGRRALAAVLAPVAGVAAQLVPVSAVAVAGAAAVTVASVALSNQPAHASVSGETALILSTSVNGGTSSLEAQQATALGMTVTVATPATWDAMTKAQFQAYNVIIIGDPSTTTCATAVPADALSTAGTWGAAVNGNVSVLGTAPALGGATTLVNNAIYYAASGGTGMTGLYVSLNCEYSAATAATAVPLLASVDGGGGFTVTGQGASCPANAGTVNTWQALAMAPFNGLTSANLGPWAAPACSVEETFNDWPGGLAGLGYYTGTGATPATFTASDGATGQAYILAGAPVPAATAALAPSTGGQVPAGSAAGGVNPAAPGVNQPSAGGVNTASGDFSLSAADFSVPVFGPSLSFSRSYSSQVAQAQTRTGTPGPLGYGWTSNWASSLQVAKPVPGSIYTVGGLRTNNGNGGPPLQAPLDNPGLMVMNNGNLYFADTTGNRVQEIPGTTGTQWGQPMTAGDEYTIAGSPTGASGASGNGTPAGQALLNGPGSIALDASGNLYIADTSNNRVLEVPAVAGQNRGFGAMTVNDVYVIAGTGTCAVGADGGAAAASALCLPWGVATPPTGSNVYIADSGNNRVQEVAAASGSQWNQPMTANDVYTVAGSAAGTAGNNGASGLATLALINMPDGVAISPAGDIYIAVTGNNKIQEVSSSTRSQWNQPMTAFYLYNINSSSGAAGYTGDGGNVGAALLNSPVSLAIGNGYQLYVADAGNNRVQEVAATGHAEWGIPMTAFDIYTIAGSATGAAGFSGDGGSALSALMSFPESVAISGSSMYVMDTYNNELRLVNSSDVISHFGGNLGTLAQTGNRGPAFTAGLSGPQGEAFDAAGDMYVADTMSNRVQEIAAVSHTQYGIVMTAGDVYTVAGSSVGYSGSAGDGGQAIAGYLNTPMSVAMDGSGNLFIADTNNCRVQKVTAGGVMSTVAGFATPACGLQASPYGDGVAATASELTKIEGVAVDGHGDIYIADTQSSRIQEVYAAGGQAWGQAMTAGDMYTMAGHADGTAGYTGGNGVATAAYLNLPVATGQDAAGNLYIADWGNNRIQEVAGVSARMRNRNMTYENIYTIAGSVGGSRGHTGDGGAAAAAALLWGPGNATSDAAGNLYITDGTNNRVQEIAAGNGTQWGQAMSANYIYTVAGSAAGTAGNSGDGGPATAALMTIAENVSLDPAGNMYVTDGTNNRLREVTATTTATISPAPGQASTFYPAPGGITVTQPDGSQVTFYSQTGGQCAAGSPYVPAGAYCALPENVGTSLTFDSGTSLYTFTPQPGTSYTYNTAGQLKGESDAAGNALAVAYGITPGTGKCPSNASTSTCQLITSASGRALTVGYNSSNMITSVTDPMARAWTYAYTGADITTVTDPMNNVTTYAYDTTNANPVLASDITAITQPNGQTGGPNPGARTTLAYDTTGRVTTETDPMGYATTYTWTGYNPSTGNGIITVNDPDGNKTVYYYTQGTLGAKSAWTGTTLTSEQDYVPNQTAGVASGGTQLVMASANGNGIITAKTYDGAGNVATSMAPDGITNSNGTQQLATTTMQAANFGQSPALNVMSCISNALAASTCASSAGPAAVAPGGVITPPSSAPPQGLTWTLYDKYGNELYTTTGVYEPGSNTAAYSQTTYQLFNGNTITLGSNNISCTTAPPSPSLPCARINADGVVTQLAYNTQGDLTSSSTPDGNGAEIANTTYTYDGDGEQTNLTTPDGNLTGANAGNYTTVTAYNAGGQKTSETQAGGTGATVTPRVTNYGYDFNGNQTTVQDARGHTTTMAYNADDQSTLATDPDLHATLTCYDGAGNITQKVPPVGVAAGSLTAASCPSAYPAGYTTRLAADATADTFNALGQKTQETTPAPAGQTGFETTSYLYDANGNLTQTTAPATVNGGPAQITTDTYDAANHLISETTGSTTPAAATISYCYDPDGNETAVIYGNGNTSSVAPCDTNQAAYPWIVDPVAYPAQGLYQTVYKYDSANEVVSTTTPVTAAAPSGATTTATYDAAGNTLTRLDPNSITTTWTYTPLNKPATVAYSGSSAHSVSYGYDANGNRTSMSDATGSSSYIWDPFSELTSATSGASQVTGYGYNADGQVSSITYPLPATATWAATPTVNYGYDNADHLTSVTDFNSHQITITPNADSLLGTVTLGTTGGTITTTYSNTDTPSAIVLKNTGGTILQQFNYAASPAGTIVSECDATTCVIPTATYAYDAKRRVTSMTTNAGTSNYGFDASSNLTSLPTGATTTYDKAGGLTSSTLSGTTTSYSYNADGQRLAATQGSSTISSATWNGAGQLATYSAPASSMTAAAYNSDGQRATATTGGTTENFTWNTVGRLPQVIMDSGSAYIYDGGVVPAEQVSLATGTATYLVTDSLGSVRGTVSAVGTVTGTTSYDAWGNPATTGGLTSATPFGYAGGYTDPTGLIYLLNRYYQSSTGQFISADPVLSQTSQPYEYAVGEPTKNTDPTGQSGRGCTWYDTPGQQYVNAGKGFFCGYVWGFSTWVGEAWGRFFDLGGTCNVIMHFRFTDTHGRVYASHWTSLMQGCWTGWDSYPWRLYRWMKAGVFYATLYEDWGITYLTTIGFEIRP